LILIRWLGNTIQEKASCHPFLPQATLTTLSSREVVDEMGDKKINGKMKPCRGFEAVASEAKR
jgi:hypothetical protein